MIRHLMQPPREKIHADEDFQNLIDFVELNPRPGQGQIRLRDQTNSNVKASGSEACDIF
jgi:hypothetical protein